MDDSSTSFAIPDELPVLPLRDMVVFPYMVLPLFVARERSIAAIEDALAGDRLLMVVAQRDGSIDAPEPDDLFQVGTVVMVMRILRMADGRVKVLVQGMAKAPIDSFVDHETSTWVRLTPKPEDDDAKWCVEAEALVRAVRGHVEELLPLKNLPPEVLSITANVNEPGRLADLVASNLKLQLSEAQEILEVVDPLVRLRKVDAILRRELEVTSVQAEIQSQAHDEMSRNQREHFLREQLRAIQEELGGADPHTEEVEDYRVKIEEVGMDEEALTESMRQLRRLERIVQAQQENAGAHGHSRHFASQSGKKGHGLEKAFGGAHRQVVSGKDAVEPAVSGSSGLLDDTVQDDGRVNISRVVNVNIHSELHFFFSNIWIGL